MQEDKKLHLIAGIIISLLLSALFNPVIGFWGAFFAGIGKEIYDSFGYGNVEVMDIIMTIVGGIIGVVIICLL